MLRLLCNFLLILFFNLKTLHTRHVGNNSYQQILQKALVLDWETKLQAVNSYIYITPSDNDSLEEDNNADNKREEWMLMAELNIQTNDFYEQSTLVQQASGISTFHNKGNQCNAFVDKQRQKTEVVLTLYAQQEL